MLPSFVRSPYGRDLRPGLRASRPFSGVATPHLYGAEHAGKLMVVGMKFEGSPLSGTRMHAHRRRGSEVVDPFLTAARRQWRGTRPHHLELARPSRAERLDEVGVSDAECRDEGSCSGPHLEALGHDAVVHEAPEGDQQLAPEPRSASCASQAQSAFAADTIRRVHYPSAAIGTQAS
jgi:hypothetical protein